MNYYIQKNGPISIFFQSFPTDSPYPDPWGAGLWSPVPFLNQPSLVISGLIVMKLASSGECLLHAWHWAIMLLVYYF